MGQAKKDIVRVVKNPLVWLGKPLYLLLTYSLLFFLTALFLGSRFVTRIINNARQFKLKTPAIKIRLPSIHLRLPLPPLPHLPHVRLKVSSRRLLIVTLPIIGFASIGTGTYFYVFKDLPHPKNLITRQPALTTKIYDRHHQLLYKVYDNENRSLISLSELPPHVIHATLAIEDADFYNHAGFSFKGIVRAFQRNLTRDTLQGGSTITQQLVKNTLLTPERTFQRKVRELVLAVMVENYFTKDEILTMYFNEVPYGGPTYGIEEASQAYFKKSARQLTIAEAAVLAGLPAAPTIFSPFGSQPELALARQHEVLRRMTEVGYITQEEADAARNDSLSFAPPTIDIKAPHFVMYVKDVLARTYGDPLVDQGGLSVVTSLDLDIQEMAEAVVKDELQKLSRLNITNAAALVTNPRTGEVLAMVGSGNYFDTANDGQVNVTTRLRQPGSSIKPLMYSLALANGFTATSIIDDSPITYRVIGSPPYSPRNYDNQFRGKVTLRQALANSYNIPAVKVLSQLGVSNMVDHATFMGITTWTDPSRFGLALSLGAGEVRMVDMAVAYGTLANYGRRVDLHPVLEVTDISDHSLEAFNCTPPSLSSLFTPVSAVDKNPTCTGTPVVNSGIAYILTHILSDNQARAQAFGTNSVLQIPGYEVAVKTGTTNSLRDNWTIGYTPDYLVAVWVGNNDNTPMSYVASGITGASPIWARIMTSLLKNTPEHTTFIEPPDVVKIQICPLTGTLNCGACPNPRVEYFVRGTEPTQGCSDDQIQRLLYPDAITTDNPRDQLLEGVSDDSGSEPQSPPQSRPNNRRPRNN
jgi:1A family penicillin-binding protein